jgi:transcriptional regulator with XRE-family HTH domain
MSAFPSTRLPRLPPLARLRILKGLTQEQLAVSTGIDRGELSRIERGIRPLRPLRLASIAQVLGYTPDELAAQLRELTESHP